MRVVRVPGFTGLHATYRLRGPVLFVPVLPPRGGCRVSVFEPPFFAAAFLAPPFLTALFFFGMVERDELGAGQCSTRCSSRSNARVQLRADFNRCERSEASTARPSAATNVRQRSRRPGRVRKSV